ncbi:MAG: M28 family peptidase [Planctomycetota bacterium]|nr:M28 family peptidase [Planctomycetota bacterium]
MTVLLASLLLASVPTVAPSTPTAPRVAGNNVALARGLETIAVNEISADIHYIASDEMGGRDTVSEEQRIAARFIKNRLVRLGFTPGNGEKFLYEYPLAMKALDPASLSASVDGTAALAYGSDYTFTDSFGAAALTTDGGLVFCGTGERDDFDAEALPGSWAVCSYSDQNIYRLRSRARKAGAVGLVLVPAADADLIADFAERDDAAFAGSVSWPSTGGSRSRAPFPVIAVSAATSAALGVTAESTIGADLGHSLAESRDLKGGGEVMAENVCGFWPGSDPELSKEVLIVSAHYDHVGTRNGKVYNGADDNGSGTSGLLALAEGLKEYGPMRRSVLLIWVSGEEKGLWGSKAWAQNPSLPEGYRPVANLNMDMIGRNAPNVLYVTPSEKHSGYNGLTNLAERFAIEEGFGDFPEAREQGFEGLGSADVYYGRSDHAEFAKLDIPVCFLFAGEHEDYHKDTDTPDKIDCDKIRRVSRTILKLLDALQTDTLDL